MRETAAELGISVEELHAWHRKLDGRTVVGFDDAGPAAMDRLFPDDAPSPFDGAAAAELRDHLEAAIEKLPPRQRQVLSMYYGEGLTQWEIGEVMGLVESRICQILGDAARNLRKLVDPSVAAESG